MNFYERLVAVDTTGSESVEQPIRKVGDSIRGYMQEPKGYRVEDSLSGSRLSDAQLHKLACTMFTLPRSENRRILRKVNDSVRRKLIDQGKRIRRAVADGILDYDPELSWALRHIIDFDNEDGLDILLDRDKAGKLPEEVKTWFDAYMENRHSNATYEAQQKLGNFRYTVLNQRRPMYVEDANGEVAEFMAPAAEEEVAIDEAVEEGVKSVESMSDKAEDVVHEAQDKIEQEFTSFAERISRMVEEAAEDVVAAQAVGSTEEKVEEVVDKTEVEASEETEPEGEDVSETDLDAFVPVEDAGLGTAMLKGVGGALGNVVGGIAKGVGSLGRSFAENFVEEMGGDYNKLKGGLKRLWNASAGKATKEFIESLPVKYPDGIYLVKPDGNSYIIHNVLDKDGDVSEDLSKKYRGTKMNLDSSFMKHIKEGSANNVKANRFIVVVDDGVGRISLADEKWNPLAQTSKTTALLGSGAPGKSVVVASGELKDKSLAGRKFVMHLDASGRFIVDKVYDLKTGALDVATTDRLKNMEFSVTNAKPVPAEYKDKLLMVVPVTGKYTIGYSPASDSAPVSDSVSDEFEQLILSDLLDTGMSAIEAGDDNVVIRYDAENSILSYSINDATMASWDIDDLADELSDLLEVVQMDVAMLKAQAAKKDSVSPVSDSDDAVSLAFADLKDHGFHTFDVNGSVFMLRYDPTASVLTYLVDGVVLGTWEVDDLSSILPDVVMTMYSDVHQFEEPDEVTTESPVLDAAESLSRDGFLADVVAALKSEGRYAVDALDGSHALVRNTGNGVDFIYHMVNGEVKDFWNAGADPDKVLVTAAQALLDAVWADISGEDATVSVLPAPDDIKPQDVEEGGTEKVEDVKPEEVKDAGETGNESEIDWVAVGDILYDWGKAHSFQLAQDASQEALILALHDLSDALADTRLEVRIDESVPQLLLKDQRYIVAQPDALLVGTTAFVYQMESDGVEAFASGVSRSGVQLGQEIYSAVTDSAIPNDGGSVAIDRMYAEYKKAAEVYNDVPSDRAREELNLREAWLGLPLTSADQKEVVVDSIENVMDAYNRHVLEDAIEVIKNKGDWKRWPYAADLTFLQRYPKMRAVFDDVLTEEQKENVLKQVETEIKEALKEKGINIEDSVSVSVQTEEGTSASVMVNEDGSASTTVVSGSTGDVVSTAVEAGVTAEVSSSDPEPALPKEEVTVSENEEVELPESSVGVAEVMDGAPNTYDAPHDYTTYKKIRNTRTVLDSVLAIASKVADCSPMSIEDYCAACAAKKVPASHLKYMGAVADTVFQLNELDLICDSLYKRKLSDSFWVSDCGAPVAEAFGIELDEDAASVPVVVSNAAFPMGVIPEEVPVTAYDLGDGKVLHVAVVDLDR